MNRRRRTGFLLAGLLVLAALRASTGMAAVDPPEDHGGLPAGLRVLILHAYHHGFTWTDNLSDGIRSVFAEEAGEAELKFEFLDTRFCATKVYLRAAAEMLHAKYANRRVDVIIACDDHALTFMLDHGREVFPGVPVVFCSASGYRPEMRERLQLTGLRESIDIRSTVRTALRLHPGTEEIAVILDTSRTGQALRQKAEAALGPFAGRVRIRYLEDLTVEQLKRKMPELPRRTVVLLFIFRPDETGRVLSHERNLERLRPFCPFPIYGVWEFYLGHGIVGGRLSNGHEEGRMAAQMALRILRGEDARDIPLGVSPVRYMFDYEELERFGIDPAALPEGSLLVNAPFSFYETYKGRIWVVGSAFVLLMGVIAILAIVVAARKRAEEALRRSEGKFRGLVESSSDWIWEVDAENAYTYASPQVETILGYTPDEILGKTPFDLIPSEEAGRMEAIFANAKASGGAFTALEYISEHKDGRRIVLETSGVPVRDAAGRVTGYRGIDRDVTERKRAEEEKAHIEEQYQQAQKVESIGRLAGGVAHDLNNLLSPIIGYSEIMLEEFGPGDARSHNVEEIVRAGMLARDLVRQLLAFSRKQTLERRPVNLSQAVTGIEKLLRRAIREDIEIEIVPSPDVRTVQADIGQIEQVILNLAVNAQDAMPEGGRLTIETAMAELDEDYAATRPDVQPGPHVMLALSDTGCGMDEETRKHVFEPFFSTKGEQGTGLGLATVYGIVKQHGGNIWVYSEMGKGTTFKVYLPVGEEPAEETQPVAESPVDLTGTETVLIVEDDRPVRELGRSILERHGYNVLVSEDGREALVLLASHEGPIHLLLTDVVMPEMNGKELYARAVELQPGLKALYMSGYTDNVIAHHGVLDEGIAFIQKPFTVQALATKVREVLSGDREPAD